MRNNNVPKELAKQIFFDLNDDLAITFLILSKVMKKYVDRGDSESILQPGVYYSVDELMPKDDEDVEISRCARALKQSAMLGFCESKQYFDHERYCVC